jgi:hypothetical protein
MLRKRIRVDPGTDDECDHHGAAQASARCARAGEMDENETLLGIPSSINALLCGLLAIPDLISYTYVFRLWLSRLS